MKTCNKDFIKEKSLPKGWKVSKENNAANLFNILKLEKKKLIYKNIIMDKKDKHVYPILGIPFEIPKSWVWCYLSDISIIQEGPGIRKYQYTNEGVQFLTVTNILEGCVDLNKSKKYISLQEYNSKYVHFTINRGDIVTACSGGSWGKSSIYDLDDKIILNTSTLRLRFYNDLGNNKYLYFLTKASYFKKHLSSYSTGQQPNYGYSHYSKIPIPLPPLHEQKRIVSILEKAFTAIDQAKANAEKNLENAPELFQSKLQETFANGKLKIDNGEWEEKKLGEVCDIAIGKTPARSNKKFWDIEKETNNIWLSIRDLGNTQGKEVVDSREYISNSGAKLCNLVKKGTLLASFKLTLGRLAFAGTELYTNEAIASLKIKNKGLANEYLYHYLTFFDWDAETKGDVKIKVKH